ncbi:aminotransferase class V-fold PLP-dependent enzyme, partial [Staphylococcus aureus]|nr:aminotransferase class V-fold PLP-dependent enzyme [Staphylococcus aureus]
KLQERAIPFELNGSMTDATGHIVNLYFPFVEVETMLTLLDMAQIYDIQDIIAETNAYFHVDAVQAIGHLDVKFDEFEIDAMSITAH